MSGYEQWIKDGGREERFYDDEHRQALNRALHEQIRSEVDLIADAGRKSTPIATGVLDYFPLALAEVARVSKVGSDQHNPGEPLHWARDKSTGHADCLLRHLVDRGKIDTDGMRHSAKVAWRALALLQTELEKTP